MQLTSKNGSGTRPHWWNSRYRVDYITTSGDEGCFGPTDEPDGGMPFASAKLLPWVESATVIDLREGTILRSFRRTILGEKALAASA